MEKNLEKLDYFLKRITRSTKNPKSIEQNKIIKQIYTKIEILFPFGTILKKRKNISQFLQIYLDYLEKYLKFEAETIGRDLINILNYLHGILQGPYTKQMCHFYVNNYNLNTYKKSDELQFVNSLIIKIDYWLISCLEFLLKRCQNIFHYIEHSNKEVLVYKIVEYVKMYHSYIIHSHNLSLLNSFELQSMKLIFIKGLDFYCKHEYKSDIFYKQGRKLFETYNSPDLDIEKDYFNELKEDFTHLDNIWLQKFGYKISNLINALENFIVVPYTMIYHYTAPFEHEPPDVDIRKTKGKSIDEIKRQFEMYLYKIILPYFEDSKFRVSSLTMENIKDYLKFDQLGLNKEEIDNILKEIIDNPDIPFNTFTNNLANRIFFPLPDKTYLIIFQGLSGAIRERIYIRMTELSDSLKQETLTNQIKRICRNNGFKIHPLSGVKMRDEYKNDLGDIDVIAIKDSFLVLIESKIIPQHKVEVARTTKFYDYLKNLSKKITRFDKNIKNFKAYCQDYEKVIHFHQYEAKETMNLSEFQEIKYFFVTPYLVYQPPYYKVSHPIEMLSPSLLEIELTSLKSEKE